MPAVPDTRRKQTSLTRLPAWRALAAHRRELQSHSLRELFDADPQRFSKFSAEACGMLLDYSKCLVTRETLDLLLALARERNLEPQIADLLSGKQVNTTEKRAAWHSALRAGDAAPAAVRDTLAQMRAFTTALREHDVHGHAGGAITDVVSLGIGGSALGPALAAAACAPTAGMPKVHFAATPGEGLARTLAPLNAQTTLFIVQSKSFSTQETLRSASAARRWLQDRIGSADTGMHFAAVTAHTEAARNFGVPVDRIFPMWDWVGGRYSLWSAVGLPAMIAMGTANFDSLLDGAREMDGHFASAPPENNLPILLALSGLWHANFCGMDTRAVIPYVPGLELLPAWLQQLEMESLGKGVDHPGKTLRHGTGTVVWGSNGPECQHSFFQLLHQGTTPVPVDFIACRNMDDADTNAFMLANCFAQSALLMRGVTKEEARLEEIAAGVPARKAARLAPHRALPGNRPSNTLLLPALTPRALGALLALYEHRTFVQAAIWNINAFDQWGVEHGKKLAGRLLPEFSSPAPASAHDASTNGLVNYVKTKRTENP